MESIMNEKIPLIERNGIKYIISIDKLWTLWFFIGSIFTIIVAAILWWVNDANFKKDSAEERLQLMQSTFEMNYNIRSYIIEDWKRGNSENKKLNENTPDFEWKSYAELAEMLKLKPLRQ